MKQKRNKVAVIGLGASGDAAARLALHKGARVHVTDSSSEDPVAARGTVLRDLGAEVRLGGHDIEAIASADTVVVSPGIPPGAPVLAALRARGVAWVSEPEFACRFIQSPLTIVTGTNGKTTTAALCAHLLREAGVDVALGGNIGGGLGPPASALAAADPAADRIVLELSSFQLADIRDLTPDVGVMTNLGVDHMDRYATVADYHGDKRRLFEAGDGNTTWVVNGDDPAVLAMAEGVPGTHLTFSTETAQSPGAYLSGGDLVLDGGDRDGPRRVAAASDMRLLGRHNLANALAALLAATASGASTATAPSALRSFPPLPHRLEPVGTFGGVLWVNDSKATNVAAAASALGEPGRSRRDAGGRNRQGRGLSRPRSRDEGAGPHRAGLRGRGRASGSGDRGGGGAGGAGEACRRRLRGRWWPRAVRWRGRAIRSCSRRRVPASTCSRTTRTRGDAFRNLAAGGGR